MSDKPSMNGMRHDIAPPRSTNRMPRTENLPPLMNGRPGHRLTRSQEEEQRMRTGGKLRGPAPTLDIFADPPEAGKPPERRPRRNSDSSIADRNGKPMDPEEERRRRERRHRERDARHRDNKSKPIPSSASKSKKPSHRLDVIDKLDVTSIYGTGRRFMSILAFVLRLILIAVFHHDGPFDACNPHRNRKGSQRAPMQAFPKDSANNVLGGSGPVNKNIDIAQFHGHTADGFDDYSAPAVANPPTEPPVFEPYAGASAPYRGDARPGVDRTTSFNPGAKADIVHGHETLGLGTSTFLEGAPAPRIAIQRRESESEVPGAGGGIERKRSLAQKIRGISNARNNASSRGVNSPEPVYEVVDGVGDPQNAGGVKKFREANPFFNDYDDEYEKKGARIQIAEEQNKAALSATTGGQGRARAPSNPVRGLAGAAPLERRFTSDTSGAGTLDTGESKSGGFLSRVRSLRGGKKSRPQRGE